MKMMHSVTTDRRTTPLVWIEPTAATTLPDSVPLHRLISVGITLVVASALFTYGLRC